MDDITCNECAALRAEKNRWKALQLNSLTLLEQLQADREALALQLAQALEPPMAEWVALERKYGCPFLTKENPSCADPNAITVECDIALARRMARALNDLDAKERDAQAVSFAYGNVKLHNPRVTREMVEEEMAKLKKEKGK